MSLPLPAQAPVDDLSPAGDTPSLHGMAVFTPLSRNEPDMNRSLLMALPELQRQGVNLLLARPRSTRHAFFRSLRALLKRARGKMDFLLINSVAALSDGNAHGLAMLRMARLLRLPVAIYWHEAEATLDRLREESPQRYWTIVDHCSHPDTLHLTASAFCSESIRRCVPGARPVEVYECGRVPPPFDEPAIPAEPPTVLSVGPVQLRKGPDLFVQTAIEVCRQRPGVCFRWLGSGPELEQWRQRLAGTPFAARIQFFGASEAPYLDLRRASVMFLTSREDPFPLPLLDGMCLARSVVAFDVGGASEALAGEGQLVPAFDTTAAAEAILRCLDRPAEQRLAPALRQRYLQLYTPSAVASRLAQILREHVLKKRPVA